MRRILVIRWGIEGEKLAGWDYESECVWRCSWSCSFRVGDFAFSFCSVLYCASWGAFDIGSALDHYY